MILRNRQNRPHFALPNKRVQTAYYTCNHPYQSVRRTQLYRWQKHTKIGNKSVTTWKKRPSFKNPTVAHLRNSPSPPATEANVHYSTHKTLQTVIIMSDVSNPHSPTEFKIHFNIILTSVPVSQSSLRLYHPRGACLSSGFPIKFWHALPISSTRGTCPAHFILHFVTSITFYENIQAKFLCNSVQPSTTSSLGHQPNPCSSHYVRYIRNTYSLCTRICDDCKWISRSFHYKSADNTTFKVYNDNVFCAQRKFSSEDMFLIHAYETALTWNSHATALWPSVQKHNSTIPMYLFLKRFYETKFPVAVQNRTHRCSYAIPSLPSAHACKTAWWASYRIETYCTHEFLPGRKRDEIQCLDALCGVFGRLHPCRQPTKITTSVRPSVYTHEITRKSQN